MSLVNCNTGHPNILRLYEWFDAPEYYVLVLERPEPCRDLSDFCSPQNKLDEQLARVVIQPLPDALLHCQHSGVFHRDVKPANVPINTDTNRVTLIDFGVGTHWTNTPYTSFVGTLAFAPPEWFRSGVNQAGPATVWSLGVTLYNIVCGSFPYNDLEDPGTMGIIFYPEELSPLECLLVNLMKRCLAPQVELRASLEELQHHPWLRPSCIQSSPRWRNKVLSLIMDVELRQAENAWRPSFGKVNEDQDLEESVTQELFRQMRSIINQLTPEMFERLMEQVKELSINTQGQLEGIGEMVLEKAICEMKFASTYAKMCCELKELTVPCNVSKLPLNFQSLMLDLCQKEALKVISESAVLEREWQDQRAAKGVDRQKMQKLEATVTAHRKRAVGSMKFLGELHKLGVVKDGVILECITEFLDAETEVALECLCCLITTAGSILNSKELKPQMDLHFCRIESVLKKRQLTSKVRFMLQGLMILRLKNWVPRREEQGPKTIHQIHQEGELESQLEAEEGLSKQLLSKPEEGRNTTPEAMKCAPTNPREICQTHPASESLGSEFSEQDKPCEEQLSLAVWIETEPAVEAKPAEESRPEHAVESDPELVIQVVPESELRVESESEPVVKVELELAIESESDLTAESELVAGIDSEQAKEIGSKTILLFPNRESQGAGHEVTFCVDSEHQMAPDLTEFNPVMELARGILEYFMRYCTATLQEGQEGEEILECLCCLLSTISRKMDIDRAKCLLEKCVHQLEDILKTESD